MKRHSQKQHRCINSLSQHTHTHTHSHSHTHTSVDTSFSLFKAPFGALGQLLRWLDHLVLHCTDEAQLGRNSCLQFALQAPCPFCFMYVRRYMYIQTNMFAKHVCAGHNHSQVSQCARCRIMYITHYSAHTYRMIDIEYTRASRKTE